MEQERTTPGGEVEKPFEEKTAPHFLWIQRGLMAVFAGVITLWYFTSPYLVHPHPKFGEDMASLINNLSSLHEGRIENWTKWRLYLKVEGEEEEVKLVHAMSHIPTSSLTFPMKAELEWRSNYQAELSKDWWSGSISVTEKHPWYSKFGIYSHYHTQVIDGTTVRFVPNFMFGLSFEWIQKLYPGGGAEVPVIGMITESVDRDRVIVQCFMNLTIVGVILVLFMNNPPKSKTAKHQKMS